MTFLDKLKESAKAAAEQTKIIAKNVSEKAEAAMEIQKLSNGIEKHKQNRNEAYKKSVNTFTKNSAKKKTFLLI